MTTPDLAASVADSLERIAKFFDAELAEREASKAHYEKWNRENDALHAKRLVDEARQERRNAALLYIGALSMALIVGVTRKRRDDT